MENMPFIVRHSIALCLVRVKSGFNLRFKEGNINLILCGIMLITF